MPGGCGSATAPCILLRCPMRSRPFRQANASIERFPTTLADHRSPRFGDYIAPARALPANKPILSRSIARLRQKKPDHRAIIVTLRPSENLCKIPGGASSVILLGVTTILEPDSGNEATFSRRPFRPRSPPHPLLT